MEKVIDFNYPQDVSKKALADLDKAFKSGDGELTVDALVRYGIAQAAISQENMPDIISHIETAIAKEKRPHFKALLYYFEALVYQSYRERYASWSRENPEGEEPADVSEWDRSQFDTKILELIRQSLANPEALKQVAVTSLPNIIKCNELGATYVPTLNEFMIMKDIELLKNIDGIDVDPMKDALKNQWVDDTQGNVPAHIYAITATGKHRTAEEYAKYQDSEYCALLLDYISFGSDKEEY